MSLFKLWPDVTLRTLIVFSVVTSLVFLDLFSWVSQSRVTSWWCHKSFRQCIIIMWIISIISGLQTPRTGCGLSDVAAMAGDVRATLSSAPTAAYTSWRGASFANPWLYSSPVSVHEATAAMYPITPHAVMMMMRSHVILLTDEWLAFSYSALFLNIHPEVVYLRRWHGGCHMKLLPSRRKFCVHHTTMHHVISC